MALVADESPGAWTSAACAVVAALKTNAADAASRNRFRRNNCIDPPKAHTVCRVTAEVSNDPAKTWMG
jgi:hypothetical protein